MKITKIKNIFQKIRPIRITKKQPPIMLAVLLGGAFLLASHMFSSRAATSDAILFFNPSSRSVSAGSDFALVARVDPGSNTSIGINAVQLDVTFDPAQLQLDSIQKSDTFGTIFRSALINNSAGTASIVLITPSQPDITSTSDVATFNFHAQTAGSSSVSFATSSDAAVNDDKGTLVVGTRTAAAVTVTTSSDITPPSYPLGLTLN